MAPWHCEVLLASLALLPQLTVTVPLPPGITKGRDVAVEIKKSHLKFGIRGQAPIVDVRPLFLMFRIAFLMFLPIVAVIVVIVLGPNPWEKEAAARRELLDHW